MIRKSKLIYIFSLLIVSCLFLVSIASTTFATSAEADPTPTPSVSPSPTPDPSPTPEITPTPESTTKDIPVSESNPAWLLEQEKQFYAKPIVIAAVAPTPTPTKYYRYTQTTPTPSPTPLIAQNSTQVKGTSSAVALNRQANQNQANTALPFWH